MENGRRSARNNLFSPLSTTIPTRNPARQKDRRKRERLATLRQTLAANIVFIRNNLSYNTTQKQLLPRILCNASPIIILSSLANVVDFLSSDKH